ncbi:hypothetical protein [Ornithinimicrobium cerasi]|uniref:hypothetical protein n=1 Tax=Ornithinimicrobium cerasi TaxID=2248773 RepID=UPI00137AD392|nr:hypothetical protein [Ornithinimicrobium cerasi]
MAEVGESADAPRAIAGWFGWRYAACGLGWGVVVGGATGVLVGVVLAMVLAWESTAGLTAWIGLAVSLPLMGLVYGAALGGVAGGPGGMVNAVVQPRVRGERAGWWSSWLISAAAALGTVLALAVWQVGRGVVDPPEGMSRVAEAGGISLWAVPSAVVGGWLVARTNRGLRRRGEGEAWLSPSASRTTVF